MSNKVNLKNPKNEKFEVYQEMVHSFISKAASNLFEDKYFYEEFRGVFLLSSILKITSSIISFCTGVLAIQIATKLFFGVYFSFFIGLIVGICIEGVKMFLWRINSKWFLKYKVLSNSILTGLLGLHLVSLCCSAYGGYMLPIMIDKVVAPVEAPVVKDSVLTAAYASLAKIDSEIAKDRKEIESSTSNSYKKGIASNMKLLLEQRTAKEKEITKIKDLKLVEDGERKAKTKALHEQMLRERAESIETAQISCLIASIFFELLFVACSCFSVYYLFRFDIDENTDIEEMSADNSVLNDPASSEKVLSTQRPQKAPELVEAKTASKPAKIGFHSSCVDSSSSSVKICCLEGCENVFESVVHNKKYCSDDCRKLAYQKRLHEKNSNPSK